jgi:hypothetical protein
MLKWINEHLYFSRLTRGRTPSPLPSAGVLHKPKIPHRASNFKTITKCNTGIIRSQDTVLSFSLSIQWNWFRRSNYEIRATHVSKFRSHFKSYFCGMFSYIKIKSLSWKNNKKERKDIVSPLQELMTFFKWFLITMKELVNLRVLINILSLQTNV